MNITSVKGDKIEMKLRQMGAEVQTIHGVLYYVKFRMDDYDISYVYNINAKNKYFLQRVHPYPLGAGTFETHKDIVKFIKEDVKHFENAHKSKKFDQFIQINSKLHRIIHEVEDLFLKHNVPAVKMRELEQTMDILEKSIGKTKDICDKVEIK